MANTMSFSTLVVLLGCLVLSNASVVRSPGYFLARYHAAARTAESEPEMAVSANVTGSNDIGMNASNGTSAEMEMNERTTTETMPQSTGRFDAADKAIQEDSGESKFRGYFNRRVGPSRFFTFDRVAGAASSFYGRG